MARESENIVLVHTADGTAGSGKGTVGSQLEGVPVLDTGQGYRAVTEWFIRYRNVSRDDHERAQAVTETFVQDREQLEAFAAMLPQNVRFGVDGISIDGDVLNGDKIREILYDDTVNNIIPLLARRREIRQFCGSISVLFIKDAVVKEASEVYLDGRTERQVMIRAFQEQRISLAVARLALPAFFSVDSVEAAHRTLARDKTVLYRSLADNDPKVLSRAESIKKRNARDSDPNNVDPMQLTETNYDAWRDSQENGIRPGIIDSVLGDAVDGSSSCHVRFDTTGHGIDEVNRNYQIWRENITDRLRYPSA